MPRRLLSAAAACTLLLGLAACGEGGDGPVTTPPPSIDISGSSDGGGDDGAASDGGGDDASSSAAPEVPAPDPADYPGMDENTEEGAQQFTRYFFALIIWGYETGDSSLIEELYLDTCGVCEANVESMRKYDELGVAWTPVEVDDVVLETMESDSSEYQRMVHYEATVSEHDEPQLDGSEPIAMPSTHYKLQLGIDWKDGAWVVGGAALEVDTAS